MTRNQNNKEKTAVAKAVEQAVKPSKAGRKATDKALWIIDDRFSATGQEMAVAAAQANVQSGTFWDRCRTLFVEAQEHGKAQEAVSVLFSAGDKVKGKKAPWYRTYKSLLNSCLTLNVKLDNSHGMSAVQKLIKIAKETKLENDPEAQAAKAEDLKGMFKRMAQGCLNAGVKKSELVAILKEVE